ncbi:nucleotide-binding protein [Kaarinaea lacus]
MHRILIFNSKGGCGKSTIATNLAGYFAHRGDTTTLLDYDPQGSSMKWLGARSEEKPKIHGIPAFKNRNDLTRSFQLRIPTQADWVIIDAPAGVSGFRLADYVQRVDTIIIPVLPSPIDIHATADFIKDLLLVGKARQFGTNIAVVANRVKEKTRVYQHLRKFLMTLELPYVATLRDSQDYIRAAEQGLGIHELLKPRANVSCGQWQPMLAWLQSLPTRQIDQPINNIFPLWARG